MRQELVDGEGVEYSGIDREEEEGEGGREERTRDREKEREADKITTSTGTQTQFPPSISQSINLHSIKSINAMQGFPSFLQASTIKLPTFQVQGPAIHPGLRSTWPSLLNLYFYVLEILDTTQLTTAASKVVLPRVSCRNLSRM